MTALSPGANAHLTRENPGLRRIAVGLSWDCGRDLTLRESLVPLTLLCTAQGHVLDQDHVVFHNQMVLDSVTIQAPSAAGRHPDDEQVVVDLLQVPPEVERIVFVLTVDAATTSRHLGHLRGCHVRVRDDADGRVLVESVDLAPHLGHATAAVLTSLYRLRDQWKYKVHAAVYSRGLAGVADDYRFEW
jgi:tellurium resistance protein TerD